MAVQPVIPVLSINTDQLIRRQDQVAYLIRHTFYSPGWTSSQIEGSLVSMRRLLAEHEYDISEFTAALKQKLEASVKRLHATLSVNIEPYKIDPISYGIRIAVVDHQGALVLSSDLIKVVNNEIILEFDKEANNHGEI